MDFKIHEANGRAAVAATSDATLAAAIVSVLGDGATVRFKRHVVWAEGIEMEAAYDSYDGAAMTMLARVDTIEREQWHRDTVARNEAAASKQRAVDEAVDSLVKDTKFWASVSEVLNDALNDTK